ncbi:MAG TPA: outer membrane lipoprotein carrier protein LolA [Bacillota bacterium]
MVLGRLAVAAVAALVVFAAAGCGTPPTADLIRQMTAGFEKLQDYQGVLEVQYSLAGAGQTVQIRQSFKKPARYRLEFLAPEEIKGQLTVFDGQTMWFYNPQDNEVTVFEQAGEDVTGQDQKALLSGVVGEVSRATAVKVAGRARVVGRPAYLVELTPPGPKGEDVVQRERVWVDRQTWLPLKVEAYNAGGAVISAATYTQVKVDAGLPDELFRFSPPQGAEVIQGGAMPEAITLERARQLAGFKLLLPAYTPAGFSLVQVSRVGSGQDLSILLDYSQEKASLSITENKAIPGAVALPGMRPMDLGGLPVEVIQSEEFSIIHWIVGDVELAITSDLSLEEIGRIARSLH